MGETYIAQVSWGVRPETPQECAARLIAAVDALGRLAPSFTGFWTWSRGRKRTRIPFVPDPDAMAEVFAQGVTRSENGRTVLEDLGYSVTFMNHGSRPDGLYLRMRCGCYLETLGNVCSVGLPYKGDDAERVLNIEILSAILRIMLSAMEPEEGIITSHSHWELVNDYPATGRPVGWLMYFSKSLGTVPPLPAPVRVEPVEDKGTLVILTPERLTASNPEHVELGKRVRKLLSRAGLLKLLENPPR